jgi:hypothetical protein
MVFWNDDISRFANVKATAAPLRQGEKMQKTMRLFKKKCKEQLNKIIDDHEEV